MENKIKNKAENINNDDEKLLLSGVIQRSEQSSKIVDGECMLCGDVADTKDGWICEDCRKF